MSRPGSDPWEYLDLEVESSEQLLSLRFRQTNTECRLEISQRDAMRLLAHLDHVRAKYQWPMPPMQIRDEGIH